MIFYKYAGKSGIRVIEDLRLKITPPIEFNDPFELTPRSKLTITLTDMLNMAKTNPNHYRGVFEDLKKDGYCNTFGQFITELPRILPLKFKTFEMAMRKELVKKDMESVKEASAYFGILCVSTIPNSIPMWSHYAEHHRGIVIGLDVANIGSSLGPFARVKYRKLRRAFDRWLNPKTSGWFREVMDTMFIKSRVWCYEQEYRRVFRLADLIHTRPNGRRKCDYLFDISGNNIREVIFGCRIKKAYEERIRAVLARRPKTFAHVKLFRCERHRSRFELEITPC